MTPIRPRLEPPRRLHLPPAGPSAVYCTLYKRGAGFERLVEAELDTLAPGHAPELGVWLSATPIRWAETGYGNGGGRQLAFAADDDDLRRQLMAHGLAVPRFGLTLRRIPRTVKGGQAAKVLVADCVEGRVNLDAPDHRLLVVVSRLGTRVLLEAEAGDGRWVESRHKPHKYVVALPVRIAKSMLNLTVRPGDTVLDPFCGSGTIPLLAAWAGHTAYGSDISSQQVERSHQNLAHFGQRASLQQADARETRQRADCVVTNLPYGVYSHLQPDALRDVLTNLRRLAPRVTLVASERLDDRLRELGYQIEQVVAVESDRFARFIHVTRTDGGPPTQARLSARPRAGCDPNHGRSSGNEAK